MPIEDKEFNTPQSSSMFVVILCIAMGTFPIGISLGVIPVDPAKIHAPMWVIGMMGGLFWLAGASMMLKAKPRINNFLGALMFSIFGITGGWVALKGESSQFGGGIPFLSHAANEGFSRWLFGGGALICLAVAVYAFKKAMERID